ncbi:hypothetical protein BBK36DRAFT_117502 [Trichoderma citrinoviride]|uniref:Uncharacterized protein n=1 Tax=Trichoderma citrinoviride TaxID=58853 RepID=A0A2T4AWI4_9HYPO|nr:hypothetical protein BBK36DRAFT_117502 [Trichoderma citrinoviride]PTB61420.1 hypothetical protein BBK36DRAFT_117502 [Trichoderma citrinoviride]
MRRKERPYRLAPTELFRFQEKKFLMLHCGDCAIAMSKHCRRAPINCVLCPARVARRVGHQLPTVTSIPRVFALRSAALARDGAFLVVVSVAPAMIYPPILQSIQWLPLQFQQSEAHPSWTRSRRASRDASHCSKALRPSLQSAQGRLLADEGIGPLRRG